MRHSLSWLFLIASIAFSVTTVAARAQCLDWKSGFDAPGAKAEVNAFAVFDDGMGPAIYAAPSGGLSPLLETAVSKWNGTTWTDLPSMSGYDINALITFDDGSGPALYAGGVFDAAGGTSANSVAKWNGTSWSALGSGLTMADDTFGVFALAVFDDGTGPALYAGGVFELSEATYVPNIARWNGSIWSSVGGGIDWAVFSLTVFDAGGGEPVLVAGGEFTNAGGVSANRIAQWNGTSWSTLGSGTSSPADDVYALTTFDDGSGVALYAAGKFSAVGGTAASNIAKWNGSAWSALGSGTDDLVQGLTVFDDGSGAALHAVGHFLNAGGVSAPYVARWNGSSWTSLAFSSGPLPGIEGYVRAALGFDDGSGPALFIGGAFVIVDDVVFNYVAKRQATIWSAVPVAGHGLKGTVLALAAFDGGSGSELYAGGTGPLRRNLARWNGSSWQSVAGFNGFQEIACLTVVDDGSGPALFAGGSFWLNPQLRNVARFDGASWTPLGTGPDAPVYAIVEFDDGSGPAAFVGGGFTLAGGASANRIAKWNGTSWSALGSGMSGGVVSALAVFDDGSGSALYAGGSFTLADGSSANRIAKWNGSAWSALGTGMQGSGSSTNVAALAVFDAGTGPALYAAGLFVTADGVSANSIARWNGSTWSALGSGMDAQVYALSVFDDGTGPQLFAGGNFATAGVVGASRIAKWNGAAWSALGSGLGGDAQSAVRAFSAFNDVPSGNPDLFVGGHFTSAGAYASDQIAQWLGCGPGVPYCFGDGLDPVVTAQCPCTNFGDPGHGCANSIFASGGLLSATGTASPNTIVFTLSQVPNNALATGLGNATNTNPGGVIFGDGVRCQSGALVRFGSHNTGTLGDAPNTWSASAFPVAPGLTRYYQIQYRNSAPAFCPPATFNISNGYRIVW